MGEKGGVTKRGACAILIKRSGLVIHGLVADVAQGEIPVTMKSQAAERPGALPSEFAK